MYILIHSNWKKKIYLHIHNGRHFMGGLMVSTRQPQQQIVFGTNHRTHERNKISLPKLNKKKSTPEWRRNDNKKKVRMHKEIKMEILEEMWFFFCIFSFMFFFPLFDWVLQQGNTPHSYLAYNILFLMHTI